MTGDPAESRLNRSRCSSALLLLEVTEWIERQAQSAFEIIGGNNKTNHFKYLNEASS